MDAFLTVLALIAVLGLPVLYAIPYADEWFRMVYLKTHSPWEWAVHHTETWVVRPTGDFLLGVLSEMTADMQDAKSSEFLERFRLTRGLCVTGLVAGIVLQARVVFGRARLLEATAVLMATWLVVLCTADGLGQAFYWADGYFNVSYPYLLLTTGVVLITRPGRAGIAGVGCLLLAASLHELMSIFSAGFALLTLVLRRDLPARNRRALAIVLALAVTITLWQLFGAGPEARTAFYAKRKHGEGYRLEGAWQALRAIGLTRSLTTYLAATALLTTYRTHLGPWIERAASDYRAHRLYWWLLLGGALAMVVLPLGAVGLTKPSLIVSYYSVATQLFVVLVALVTFPMIEGRASKLLSGYRQRVGSVLPIIACVFALSPNRVDISTALTQARELRAQSIPYLRTVKRAKSRVLVCRPAHPFMMEAGGLTEKYMARFFEVPKPREKICEDGRPVQGQPQAQAKK